MSTKTTWTKEWKVVGEHQTVTCAIKVIKETMRTTNSLTQPNYYIIGALDNDPKIERVCLQMKLEQTIQDAEIQLQTFAIDKANTPLLSQEDMLLIKLGFTKQQNKPVGLPIP